MNKIGMEFETLIKYLIVLVVFFMIVYFFFLSPSGLNAITKIGEKLGLSSLPEKPQEKLKESEIVPNDVKDSAYNLIEAVKFGKDNKKDNCLIKYNTLSESVSDFNIDLKEANGLSITVYNRLKQLETDIAEVIYGLKPCYYNAGNSYFYDITINRKDKIMADKEVNYPDVKISNENYKLLYKESNVCLLAECDNNCLTLLIKDKKEFCDDSYKDIFKDIFYQ